MRRSLLVLIISGISTGAVASGYAIWSYVSADRVETAAATAMAPGKSASVGQSTVAALTPPPNATPPGVSALLAIEVARIEAGGPSVLAGRSPPKHKVTILANGREIASVTATDDGQWAAVVPDGIAAGPLELSIVSEPKEGGAPVRGAARQLVVPPSGPALASAASPTARPQAKAASAENRAPAPAASPQPIERPKVEIKRPAPVQARPAEGEDAASKRALAEFEALVERTRKEMAADQTPRPAPAAGSGGSVAPVAEGPRSVPSGVPSAGTISPPSAPVRTAESPAAPPVPAASETKLAAAMPAAVSSAAIPTPAAVQAPIPVPITFSSNRAALTPNGERAASLLAEYLRLKRPAGITLSGHADARGPDGYNMRLSLKRLEVIQRYLRAAGYSGELSLLPRGKRDPYQGIDRRRLPLREIHQADRRVELQLTP
jgi:outer membrane protein OmpA-like peptidoglycan-associated protein